MRLFSADFKPSPAVMVFFFLAKRTAVALIRRTAGMDYIQGALLISVEPTLNLEGTQPAPQRPLVRHG